MEVIALKIEKMKVDLKEQLSKKRFGHSLRVAKLSENLANHYGIDTMTAYYAGLIHDIAKEYSREQCLYYINEYAIEKDPSIMKNPNLAHGEIGAIVLQNDYNEADEDVLDAVRWHTYGHENMSLLSKIVYIADAIEPLRDYNGVDVLRKLAYEDLNLCIREYYAQCTQYVQENDQMIHQNTVKMIKTLDY